MALLIWAAVPLARPVQGETFRLPGPPPREVSVEPVTRENVVYAPIEEVIAGLGGGARVIAGRAQLDFQGYSAWIEVNRWRVDSTRGRFDLTQPLRHTGGTLLMALNDVVPFFQQAFAVQLQVESSGGQAPSPATPAPIEPPAPATSPQPAAKPDAAYAAPRRVYRPIQRIVIDPGHGGVDDGAVGSGGLREKDVAMAAATELKRALEAAGTVTILLTRGGDARRTTDERSNLAIMQRADLFISLHAGASYAADASGCRIYIPLPADGSSGLESNAARYEVRSRGIAGAVGGALREAGVESGGVRQVPCTVLQPLDMPSLLIELGYLNNPGEEQRLGDSSHITKLAEAIAAGVAQELGTISTGSTL